MNAPAGPIGLETSVFSVEGMRCAACIARIEKGLAAIPGIADARVNLSARRVRVRHDNGLDEEALVAAFAAIGFDAHAFAGDAVTGPASSESRRLMLATAVAGFAAMNVMLLSVSIWSGADGSTRQLFHWLSALIALPTLAYSGRPFFASAAAALENRRTNMDVPISIGVLLTSAMSLWETWRGGPHAYFDGVVMLLFFLLAGRWLDSLMRARAEDSVASLLRRVPSEASRIVAGQPVRVAVTALTVGDRLLVAAGERVAADGIVVAGESAVDRALITGESRPDPVLPGSSVLAGTINLSAPIEVDITATGENRAIADIARLMAEAGQARSRYVRIADRASRLYAPAVHTLAALTFVGWWLMGQGAHDALTAAVAVLIITCPCALGLAVPIAQVVAAGAMMRRGLLVRDGSALERLAGVDVAMLDKTGTSTLGRLTPVDLPADATERAILATLAHSSRHPLARGVARALEAEAGVPLDARVEVAGLGIEGWRDGVRWRLGRPDWLGLPRDATTTLAAFGRDGAARLIPFEDHLRPGARKAVVELAALKIPVKLVSGDHERVVASVAGAMGIDYLAEIDPKGKQAQIVEWQRGGAKVLMVGDGLNDAPAMRAADVAIAPAAASDVGQMSADILFFGESLDIVPVAVRAARRTMRIVRQNFTLAVGYNLVAVPLAMAGRVTPLIAALAMSGSSILVVANAMRLRRCAR